MRKSFVLLGTAVLAALLTTGTSAHAQSVPWSYIADSSPTIYNSNNPLHTSSIQLTGTFGSSSSVLGSAGGSGVVIYTITTTSGSTSGDTFGDGIHDNITETFTLTDLSSTHVTSGKVKSSDTFTFTGKLSASNVTKSGSISQATILWDQTSISKILGSEGNWVTYTATPGLTIIPQPNNAGATGSSQVLISATASDTGPSGSGDTSGGDGGVSAAPEPTSMVLACLGLPLFMLGRRRLKLGRAENNLA